VDYLIESPHGDVWIPIREPIIKVVRIAYDFPLGTYRGASGATVVQVSAYATCIILRPTIDAAAAIDATTTNMWVFCIGMTYIHE
jgi:hypothetical protein